MPEGQKLAEKHIERIKNEHLIGIKIADFDVKEK